MVSTRQYVGVDESNYRSVYVYFDDEDTVLKQAIIDAGCGEIFTDYSNVSSVKINRMADLSRAGVNNYNKERDLVKVINDEALVQELISKIGEMNDFSKEDDVYRIEFVCEEEEYDGYVGYRVNLRLYGDKRFDKFYNS